MIPIVDKGESRQLFEWVKASDLPTDDSVKHIRYCSFEDTAYYENDKWINAITDKELPKAFVNDLEWLKPIPQSSLKEDPKKSFEKIISDRISYFQSNYHAHEAGRLTLALNAIRDLIPPSNFAQSSLNEKESILEEMGEKEVMIHAFDKVRSLFESRSWIMDGRGSYPYNDDRYKEEVRYLYDEFDDLKKEVWKNIKTKTFEYREKIIADYKSSLTPKSISDSELLPCPFCGKEPEWINLKHPSGIPALKCFECQFEMQQDRRDKTIFYWNRRASLKPNKISDSAEE